MENQQQLQTEKLTQQDLPEAQPASKRAKRITALTTAFLVAAIILCVLVVSQVMSKGYVSVGGYSMFRVSTGSMEPELPIGTLLISKQTPISEIEVGDVVNYRSKSADMLGMVITHRVISIQKDANGKAYLETKGDANQYPDASYVEQKNLIGRVVYHTKAGNLLAELIGILTNPIGFLACIVLPCLAFGMLAMRDCIKNIRSEIELMASQTDAPEETNPLERELGTQEYQALCDRLRGELLEELKQGVDQKETTE